jgi:hypothetical protein
MKSIWIRAIVVVGAGTGVGWLFGTLIAKVLGIYLAIPHATAYFGGVVIQ